MSQKTGHVLIQDYLRTLDSSPGVYRMLDGQGAVLYVGKARNLINETSVVVCPVTEDHWLTELEELIERHAEETGSRRAQDILQYWELEKGNFLQICPTEMLDKLDYPLGNIEGVMVWNRNHAGA